jgi:hypothetical protein
MNILDIEKSIISKTILDYEKFDKAIISLQEIMLVKDYEGKDVPSYVLQSIYYDKDSNIINKETKLNSLISNDIKQLLSEILKEQKVNKGTLTIYHSGEYESDFVWDEQAHIDYLTRLNEAYLDSISEEFAHQFRDLSQGKTFTKGIVITDIINNEVKMETFFYDNQTLVHQTPMLIDAIWIETILQVQINLQNSELGINIINWNRMIMDIPWSETDRKGIFDVKRDVKFEWREENA